MDLNSIVSVVFAYGKQVCQFEKSPGDVLTVYRLGGLRVNQTQNPATGEYQYVVWSGKKLLGISYC
jgi:hypothetical protein